MKAKRKILITISALCIVILIAIILLFIMVSTGTGSSISVEYYSRNVRCAVDQSMTQYRWDFDEDEGSAVAKVLGEPNVAPQMVFNNNNDHQSYSFGAINLKKNIYGTDYVTFNFRIENIDDIFSMVVNFTSFDASNYNLLLDSETKVDGVAAVAGNRGYVLQPHQVLTLNVKLSVLDEDADVLTPDGKPVDASLMFTLERE